MDNNNSYEKTMENLMMMSNYSLKKNNDYNQTIENLLWDAIATESDKEVTKTQESIDNIYEEYENKILSYVGKTNQLVVSDYISNLNLECEGRAYRLGFRKAMDIMIGYIVEKSVQPIHQ